jgi:hypothetical protein
MPPKAIKKIDVEAGGGQKDPKTGLFPQIAEKGQPVYSTGIWNLEPPIPLSRKWNASLP